MELFIVVSNLNLNNVLGTFTTMIQAFDCIENDRKNREFYSYLLIVIDTKEKSCYDICIGNIE